MAEDTNQIVKLVDAANMQLWKFQVTIILKSHDLYQRVTQKIPKKKNYVWERKGANAQKVLLITIDQKPLMHIINCDTALEMWIKLLNMYERDNEQLNCNLMEQFFS